MALNLCPHCTRPLTLEERLAETCPGCGKPLASPITATPPPAIRENVLEKIAPLESPRQAYLEGAPVFPDLNTLRDPAKSILKEGSRIEQFLGWASTRTALTLFITGMILYFGGALFARLQGEGSSRSPEGTRVLEFLIRLAILLGTVQILCGMCMVIAVPAESGAKGWAGGTIACLVVTLLILIIAFGGGHGRSEESTRTLIYLLFGSILLAEILFARFLCAVASYFKEAGLTSSCGIFISADILFDIIIFFTTLKDLALGGPNPVFLVSGGWGWTLLGLAISIWLLVNTILVRELITRKLLKGGS